MTDPTFIEFPKRPSLEDLNRIFHAQPGVTYLLCKVENQIAAAKEENGGWRMLPGAPYVKAAGHECVMMYRGEVIPGTSVQVTTADFHYDPKLPQDYFEEPEARPQPQQGGGKSQRN